MTQPRRAVVKGGEGVYHCISRCVRRAHLCGFDKLTGKSFDHRKEWVRARLQQLVEIFCIELLSYSLMGNHQHTLLRTRVDRLAMLTDREVAHRWLLLYPKEVVIEKGVLRPSAKALDELASNTERISELRVRLGSISWFMKSFAEYIARRANQEDECKGSFWEGRFKCSAVEGEAAMLACSIYIDLNPIRAAIADTPETSEFTSAWERIRSLHGQLAEIGEPPIWLAPLASTPERRGFLSLTLLEYLSLLDTTGREMRKGKRGRIPAQLNPILERIGLRADAWLNASENLEKLFCAHIGHEKKLKQIAAIQSKRWVRGIRSARKVFI
ncbi:MAG: transposase [Deltaproteobacteria bacterium]|nr:transposase [Deltaproteobacteria bacterium]